MKMFKFLSAFFTTFLLGAGTCWAKYDESGGLVGGFENVNQIGANGSLSDLTFTEMVINFLKAALVVVPVLAVAGVVVGGIYYILAAGDEKKSAQAKTAILYSIAGLIIIGLAGVLVYEVMSAIKG